MVTWKVKKNQYGPNSYNAYMGDVKIGHVVPSLTKPGLFNYRIYIGSESIIKLDVKEPHPAFERDLCTRLKAMDLEVQS